MKKEFDAEIQQQKATRLRSLHHGPEMLIVANAWDAVSAKIFELAGFPAVASTSSGISWSCGYQDVERIPPELMAQVIGRIAPAVQVPVTADIEGGYIRNDDEKLSAFFTSVIHAGAVGINLEDSAPHRTGTLIDLDDHLRRIKLAREAGRAAGVEWFINARTDAMAQKELSQEERIKMSIERANAFKEAGADGVFIPFVRDIEVVRKLKEHISLPLNILGTQTLDITALKKLGVNRVSVGSRPILATMHLLMKIAGEMRSANQWPDLFTTDPNYPMVQKWFE